MVVVFRNLHGKRNHPPCEHFHRGEATPVVAVCAPVSSKCPRERMARVENRRVLEGLAGGGAVHSGPAPRPLLGGDGRNILNADL